MWISNTPTCRYAVVWAKNEEGRIKGILVERGMEGFSTLRLMAMEPKRALYWRVSF